MSDCFILKCLNVSIYLISVYLKLSEAGVYICCFNYLNFLDLLHIKGAPNSGTYGSTRHLYNEEFLKSLSSVEEEKLHSFIPRGFPEDFDEALAECHVCTCSYCDVSVLNRLKDRLKIVYDEFLIF